MKKPIRCAALSRETDLSKSVFLRASSRRLVAIQAARLTKSLLEDWEKLSASDLVSICRALPKHARHEVQIAASDVEKTTPLRSARATSLALQRIAQQRQRLRASVLRGLQRLEASSWRIVLPSVNAEQRQP